MYALTQTNPVYKGYIRWNYTNGETKTRKKEEDWIIRKGNHPAIVTEELFDTVQKRYQEESCRKSTRASASYKHWLSGIIQCSACGRSLSYSRVCRNGKNYSFFQCYGYNKKICSVSHGISEQKIVAAVFDSLREAIYTGTRYEKEDMGEEISEKQNETAYFIQMQLEKLEGKEERIYAAYIDGIDSLEEYKRKKTLLLKEKENLEQQWKEQKEQGRNQSKADRIHKKKETISIFDGITAMESDEFTNSEKNEAIRSIVEKIVYHKANGVIQVYYR